MSSFPIIGIVDDDPGVRMSLDSLLRSAGMMPRCFASAEEILKSGTEGEMACILSDLHMPGINGIELQYETCRRDWRIPLILVTAYPTDAWRDQARNAGVAAFLTKPVDPDTLLEAIERTLG